MFRFSGASSEDEENIFYIRCKDQPWLEGTDDSSRNANSESLVYILNKPDAKINIDWIEPSEEFESSTDLTTIELQVQTSGGGEYHACSYSFSGYDNMIEMFETGSARLHSQPLSLPAGSKKVYVQCEDETGDYDRSYTEFKIIHDTSTPQVARVWQSGSKIYLITNEDAECRYSTSTCKFVWSDADVAGDGEEHTISAVRGNTYYVKCEDEFGNVPSGCSITVKAV